MSRCQLVHIPIAPTPPVKGHCEKKVHFEVSLSVTEGRVHLDMRQAGGKDPAFIAIEADCEVVVELKGDQLFFSKEYDAITMKGDYAAYYGGLVYDDYDRKKDRYRIVRFHALFNRGGKLGTSHPFNINVDLHQPGSKLEWIPISIDPDIKNPPPWPV
ncbi:nucleotide synthetase [Sphingomonas crocodyli]|nr:nucleotide synthetase [Sphingomonas crocodyli]